MDRVKVAVPPRHGRQRQRTRSALLAAGESLFAARSVDGVTVDQIVDAAEVAKGSFYNHFEDKEAFADAVYELIQGDIEFHVFAANADVVDPAARTIRGICTVMRYAVTHPERLQATLSLDRRASPDSPINVGLAADLRHGLEQGQMRGIDVPTGILIVLGLARSFVARAMVADRTRPIEALGADMASATLRALGVPFDDAGRIGAEAARDLLRGIGA